MGDDHARHHRAAAGHEAGTDAHRAARARDEVLDIAVTPDRGYCLSMRGVAREAATAYGLPFRDPALLDVPAPNGRRLPGRGRRPGRLRPLRRARSAGSTRRRARPLWLQRRLQKAGMRPSRWPSTSPTT